MPVLVLATTVFPFVSDSVLRTLLALTWEKWDKGGLVPRKFCTGWIELKGSPDDKCLCGSTAVLLRNVSWL